MKMKAVVTSVLGLIAIGAIALWAGSGGRSASSSHAGHPCEVASCEPGSKTAVAAKSHGKVLGKFDPAMAGCQFACATKLNYDAQAVIHQPGAKAAKLTQCPVSGVVFVVDAKRPRVQVRRDEYVTCCETCAGKLRKDPRRFVKV